MWYFERIPEANRKINFPRDLKGKSPVAEPALRNSFGREAMFGLGLNSCFVTFNLMVLNKLLHLRDFFIQRGKCFTSGVFRSIKWYGKMQTLRESVNVTILYLLQNGNQWSTHSQKWYVWIKTSTPFLADILEWFCHKE